MADLFDINDVAFAYPSVPVIDGISLRLAPGTFYGIVGPNGSGKSTLVDLLAGLLKPARGTIAYKGKPLTRYSGKQRAREMALVPQNYHINFPYTAREVVLMGRYPHMPRFSPPSAEDRAVVEQVMADTDTNRFAGRMITRLSGGERQRVIFARALAQDAPVLILDEATANLDIHHALSLLKLAGRGVAESGRTVIAVLQDIQLAAAFCDDLIVMRDGSVHAHGAVEDILTPETIREVFRVDSRVAFDEWAGAHQVVFRHGGGRP